MKKNKGYIPMYISTYNFFIDVFVLFVLTDAQEKQIKIATPEKRASHRLGCSSHSEHLLSTQPCS